MRKIGIVTWFGGSNYGTSLQAYALYHSIEKLNAKPYLLRKHLTWRNVIGNFIRYIKGITRPNPSQGLSSIKQKKIITFKKRHFNQFPLCIGFIGKILYTFQIKQLNCIISGSDQLWNPYHTEPFLLLLNLRTLKYSYASSIGVSDIPAQFYSLYKKALADFSSISVRETAAIEPLKKLTDRPIIKVVDPTFLLTQSEWMNFAKDSSLNECQINQPYILCYFIADNEYYWEKVQELQILSDIKRVIIIPMKPGHFKEQYEIIETVGIEDFVQLIAKSKFVCTDSFHATAISINLQKDFITLLRFKDADPSSQNTRLYDLLKQYKLEDRLIKNSISSLSLHIDYTISANILREDRAKSMDYLKNIVNNN